MRHLERPSTESAFPPRLRPSSLRKTVQGQQSSSEASLCVSQIHLNTYSFTPIIPQFIKAPPPAAQGTMLNLDVVDLCCVDADRSFPGGPAQTDGYARGTFPSKMFVRNTVTERQENNHVPPEAWHPALINQQITGGHLSLQSYADR